MKKIIHKHKWQHIDKFDTGDMTITHFICECGKIKKVKVI